jgi:hypothetical protein
MNKLTILGGIAVAAASLLYAQNDKLVVYDKMNQKLKIVKVDEVKEISYEDKEDAGFKTMRVAFDDKDPLTFSLENMGHVGYEKGLPDNPLHVTVNPHHACATLEIKSDDPNAYYRVSGCPVEDFGKIPEGEWIDLLFKEDVEYCQAVAENYGKTLADFNMDDIYHRGDLTRDWWPTTILLPDEEVALLFYTAKVTGNDVEMTTEPLLVRFSTKKAEMLNTRYDVDVTFSSNTYTVNAKAVEEEGADADIPFYIDVFPKASVEASGLDVLVTNNLAMLENIIYRGTGTWSDAMYYKNGARTFTNTRVGDEMVAVAFGCEYGVVNTPYYTKEFTVPVPAKTSDATFELQAAPLSQSEYGLTVTPSDNDVKWTGMLIESSKIPDEYTRAAEVSNTIYYLNNTNPQWRTDGTLVHQGAASGISTQSGLISGKFMNIGTEYSVLVFGIDDNGCVITDIQEKKITPQSAAANMKLDLTFSNFRKNGNNNLLDVAIIPSDKNAKFVFDYLPDDNASVQLNCTDQEFIDRYVSIAGSYLNLYTYTGDTNKSMSMGSKFDSTLGMWRFGYYIAFAFGYDGEATSGLYVFKVNAGTGEVEVLRSPDQAEQ